MRYLKGSRLEEVNLVMLGEVLEARDPLGKFHDFSYSRDETLGELLPDFMTGLAGVHEGRNAHGTYLREDRVKLDQIHFQNLCYNGWRHIWLAHGVIRRRIRVKKIYF